MVVAVTPGAHEAGLRVGQRRREAQGCCPDVALVATDPRQLAVAFEPVLAAVETFSPRLEVGCPGDCVLAARGPARYFGGRGGEASLARQVAEAVDGVLGPLGWPGWVRVAVADGAGGSRLLARHLAGGGAAGVVVVPPGGLAVALAPLPVGVVCDPGVVAGVDPGLPHLLHRLGLSTVGAFAAIDPADVLARFGVAATRAHALARGEADRVALGEIPPAELVVDTGIDPPAERADAVAFAARGVAEEFHHRLSSRGATTAVVTVELSTAHGETCTRLWRHDESVAGLVDRVRWQLDGWLSGPASSRPTAGVVHLRLAPGEVVAASGRQLGLWGEERAADLRARRAATRVEALLGPDSVMVPRPAGGRSPGERMVRVPMGVSQASATGTSPAGARSAGGSSPQAPWPGAIPPPEPALVHVPARPIEVLDAAGDPVRVDGRHHLSGPPAWVGPPGRALRHGGAAVQAWAGPWPADERWWDPTAHRRRARLQVWCASGPPLLVACEGGQWWCEATYD